MLVEFPVKEVPEGFTGQFLITWPDPAQYIHSPDFRWRSFSCWVRGPCGRRVEADKSMASPPWLVLSSVLWPPAVPTYELKEFRTRSLAAEAAKDLCLLLKSWRRDIAMPRSNTSISFSWIIVCFNSRLRFRKIMSRMGPSYFSYPEIAPSCLISEIQVENALFC